MKESKKIKNAVILAAGERKCFDVPVGCLEIDGTTIIERLITLLNMHDIDNIILVTGYKSECYYDLARKKNLKLVYNERFKWTGTMNSLSLAQEYLDDDFILIESDMVFEERAISYLLENEDRNSMIIASESGSGDEALVEIRNNHIFRISKDFHQLNKIDGEFIGLSKVSFEAYKNMLDDYINNQNPYLNYEYAMLNLLNEFNFASVKIDDLVWSEIDSDKHYNNLTSRIYPKLQIKEMEIRKQYVKSLLSEVLNINPEDIVKIEKLGGLTNMNYKVRIRDEDLVARVPGIGTSSLVDRHNEKNNSYIAYEAGLDAEPVYFDENSGFKITCFIKAAETVNATTAKRENNMELMAKALRTLHSCTNMFHKTFDPFKDTEFYERTLLEANGKPFDDYYDIKEKFMVLKDELLQLGMVYTPCHLDALPENFIKSGENKMYLIDWEYSGNYDKLWDVATISVECGFSGDEEELFLRKYFGKEPEISEKRRIQIHKIMQDMCWSMWAAAKAAKGDHFLADYSKTRYTRGKASLKRYMEEGVK